jgi:hypothetical protein
MDKPRQEKEIGGEGGIRTPVQVSSPQLDFELVNGIIPPIPVCQTPAGFYSQTQAIQQFDENRTDRARSRVIGIDGRELVSFLNPEDEMPGAIGFCEYCKLPIYDSAIINHCLFRCEKYQQKITIKREDRG